MKFVDKIEDAKDLISKAITDFPKIALASSFGKDSMVVLHIALQVKPDISVFSVMTPFKPKDTLAYKKQMSKLWSLNIKTHERGFIEPSLLWDVDKCCQYYKVEPTKKAVKNLDAWITGLRRTEGRTRTDYEFMEERDGLWKINPILDFTELDVWRYLAIYNIPVNPLYALGYRSLGCLPCSAKEEDETDLERAGRWKNTSKSGGECGIHSQALR